MGMMRWITAYIDNNTERWDAERKERQEKESQWIKEWTEKTEQEKILEIRTSKTVDRLGETTDQAEQGCRAEGPQAEPPEQSSRAPSTEGEELDQSEHGCRAETGDQAEQICNAERHRAEPQEQSRL